MKLDQSVMSLPLPSNGGRCLEKEEKIESAWLVDVGAKISYNNNFVKIPWSGLLVELY